MQEEEEIIRNNNNNNNNNNNEIYPATPSSAVNSSFYPTYSPPPPLPARTVTNNNNNNNNNNKNNLNSNNNINSTNNNNINLASTTTLSSSFNSSKVRNRTFHEECEDVLRSIRNDNNEKQKQSSSVLHMNDIIKNNNNNHNYNNYQNNNNNNNNNITNETLKTSLLLPHTIQEKYRAILNEVEHLNKVLEVTLEEREDMEDELKGKLMQAEIYIREQEKLLKEKESELLHLRGAVAGLTVKLQSMEREEGNSNNIVNRRKYNNNNNNLNHSSERESSHEYKEEKHSSNIITNFNSTVNHTDNNNNNNNNNNNIERVYCDNISNISNNMNNNNSGRLSNSEILINNIPSVRIAQSALKWVKFILDRCFSFSYHNNNNNNINNNNNSGEEKNTLSNIFQILNELQQYTIDSNIDPIMIRSLCTKASNNIVAFFSGKHLEKEIYEKQNKQKEKEKTNYSSYHSLSSRTIQEREDALIQLISSLELEREALKRHARIIAEENILLLREVKNLEEKYIKSKQMNNLEKQNSQLLAERDRQRVFINELEQQVEYLEREKETLRRKLDQ